MELYNNIKQQNLIVGRNNNITENTLYDYVRDITYNVT